MVDGVAGGCETGWGRLLTVAIGWNRPRADARNGPALFSGWPLLNDRRLFSLNFSKQPKPDRCKISQLIRKTGEAARETMNGTI